MESILSKDACKVGMPTLERLIQHPFWNEYVPKFHEQYTSDASKFSLKISNSAKEHIKLAAQKTEQRLRDEQKSVCTQFLFHFDCDFVQSCYECCALTVCCCSIFAFSTSRR